MGTPIDSNRPASQDDNASSIATRKELRRQRRQEQAERRQQYEEHYQAAERRRRWLFWGSGLLAVVLLVGGLTYWLMRPTLGPDGLPGPLGGSSIAQDVNTRVGQAAPAFTLPTSDGQTYTVTPGQGRPLVLIFHMGITWQLCVQQLGELQGSIDELRQQADIYVINSDPPADSERLKQITRIAAPVLLDPSLNVAREYDMLPKLGQPMGGMSGVAQMGFVIVDANGRIRVQRADVHFGRHASQILQILRLLKERQ